MVCEAEAYNRVFLDLGPFTIYWYGVIIATGLFLGLYLANREANRLGLKDGLMVDLVVFAAPIAIISARIYYVIFEWQQFKGGSLIDLFAIWEGGIAIHGALIGAVITAIVFAKVRKVSFWQIADIAAPSIILGQAIGRWGNFMNQEAHGGEVSRQFLEKLMLPEFIIKQMNIGGTYYHPTFLYESVWSIIGVVIILLIRNREKFLLRGEATAAYLIWYGFGRFFIEGMRTDSLYIGPLRVSQIVSLLIIAFGIAMVVYQRKYAYPKPQFYTDGIAYEREFAKKKAEYEKKNRK